MPDAMFWALVAKHPERIGDTARRFMLPMQHPRMFKRYEYRIKPLRSHIFPTGTNNPLRRDPVPTLQSILTFVCAKHALTEMDVRAQSRHGRLLFARHEFCYLAVKDTFDSYPQIGRFLGRDHTTILNSVRVYCSAFNVPMPRGIDKRVNRVHSRKIPQEVRDALHV